MIGLSVPTTSKGFAAYITGAFLIGVSLTYLFFTQQNSHAQYTIGTGPIHENQSAYALIDPLIACNVSEDKSSEALLPLKEKIDDAISNAESNGLANKISVYFRDLNSGQWTGTNEDDTYHPASLFKVPVMIAYLKEAQANPAILEQQLTYNGPDQNQNEAIQSAQGIEIGKSYTVDQLISSMIVNSDNNAYAVLFDVLDKNLLLQIYSQVGLDKYKDNIDQISAKNYSLFLRVIYNSSFLGRKLSEKALELLIATKFDNGLKAGLPLNAKIANKFGEWDYFDADKKEFTARELHDCGIVYYPNHPYLLCVMTHGLNLDSLSSVLKNISSVVYKEIGNIKITQK